MMNLNTYVKQIHSLLYESTEKLGKTKFIQGRGSTDLFLFL
jgi:hypothetical protein